MEKSVNLFMKLNIFIQNHRLACSSLHIGLQFICYSSLFIQFVQNIYSKQHKCNIKQIRQKQKLVIINQFLFSMIKDSLINRNQGIQILQKYLAYHCNFQKLAEFYKTKQRTKEQLQLFVKDKLREIVTELESELFRIGKIKQLKIFDHATDQMFSQIIQFNKYLPERLYPDIVLQQKYKYEKVERSSSIAKMQLYTNILRFCKSENLFKYIYHHNQQQLMLKNMQKSNIPFSNPYQIYSATQLDTIYLLYDFYLGNLSKIQQQLHKNGYSSAKHTGSQLERNIKNIQMIGAYRCQLKSMVSRENKQVSWEKYVTDHRQIENKIQQFDVCLKTILLRMGIMEDIDSHLVRTVCKKLGQRFFDRPLIDTFKPPKLGRNEKQCNTPKLKRLRNDLITVLNSKIWFNYVGHNQ